LLDKQLKNILKENGSIKTENTRLNAENKRLKEQLSNLEKQKAKQFDELNLQIKQLIDRYVLRFYLFYFFISKILIFWFEETTITVNKYKVRFMLEIF
jgi:regulator of replication initiation timing